MHDINLIVNVNLYTSLWCHILCQTLVYLKPISFLQLTAISDMDPSPFNQQPMNRTKSPPCFFQYPFQSDVHHNIEENMYYNFRFIVTFLFLGQNCSFMQQHQLWACDHKWKSCWMARVFRRAKQKYVNNPVS